MGVNRIGMQERKQTPPNVDLLIGHGLVQQNRVTELERVNAALLQALENLLDAEVYADGEGLVTIGRADGGSAVEAVAAARSALALAKGEE